MEFLPFDFEPFTEPKLHFGRVMFNTIVEIENCFLNMHNHCEELQRRAGVQLRLIAPERNVLDSAVMQEEGEFVKRQIFPTVLLNRVVEYRKNEEDHWRHVFSHNIDLYVKHGVYAQETYDSMLAHFKRMSKFLEKYAHRQTKIQKWLDQQIRAHRVGQPHHHSPVEKFLEYNANNLRLKFGRIRAEIARAKRKFEAYGPTLTTSELEERQEKEPIAQRLRSATALATLRAEPVCKRLRSRKNVAVTRC